MHRAGAHLDVERLLNEAALRRPVVGQFENEILQRHDVRPQLLARHAPIAVPSRDASQSAGGARARVPATPGRRRAPRPTSAGVRRAGLSAETPSPRATAAGRRARTSAQTYARSASTSTAPSVERAPARSADRRRAPDRRLRAAAASTRSTAPAPPPTRRAQRLADRRAQPEQPLVRRVCRAPTRRAARRSTPRAPATCAASSPSRPAAAASGRRVRLDPVEPHQLPVLALDVGRPPTRQRLERRRRTAAATPSRSSPRRASCRGPRSGTRRCGPPRRSDRSEDERIGGIGSHRVRAAADGHPPLARNLPIIHNAGLVRRTSLPLVRASGTRPAGPGPPKSRSGRSGQP